MYTVQFTSLDFVHCQTDLLLSVNSEENDQLYFRSVYTKTV